MPSSDNKTLSLCFSGHRPENLPGDGNTSDIGYRMLISMLYLEIEESINNGYKVFYSGMARGIDLVAANIVLEERVKHPDIKLVCVIPYEGQNKDYLPIEKLEYSSIIKTADEVICLSDRYYPDCMRERNRYMVDHSDKLIAVMKNPRSGTGMTVNFARKKGIDIKIIDLNTLSPIY